MLVSDAEVDMSGNVIWKKGRGRLGFLKPLLGTWRAVADSEVGPITCTRSFSRALDGAYVRLDAVWALPDGFYKEMALIGVDEDKQVRFWSFTSDKKQSQGVQADVSDIHPEAIGFQAEMPSGLSRMAYWPDKEAGFHWVVEAMTKKGWKRFVEHHYHASSNPTEPI